MKPTYFKQFTWQRNYGLQYDLMRSLRIQYSANANSRIDEPIGRIETSSAVDSIWRSIARGGTIQNFQQQITVNYDAPIGKLPYLDFIKMPLSYRTNYNYQGATQALQSLGSVLQGSSTFQFSTTANLQTLYNKIPLLKDANAQSNAKKSQPKIKRNQPKLSPQDSLALADSLSKAELRETLKQIGYFGLRLVTCVKDFSLQYTVTNGSRLPGYMGEPRLFGLDPNHSWTPGVGYILGYDYDVAEDLLRLDLLSKDSLFNQPHEMTSNKSFTMQANLEPIRDLKIALNATNNYTSREEYYYKYLREWDGVGGPLSYIMSGSYTTTCWSMATAFVSTDELYANFLTIDIQVHTFEMALNDASTEVGHALYGIRLHLCFTVLYHHTAVFVVGIGNGESFL